MKVDCVIGLCRVLDFGTATEAGGPNGRFGQRVKGWEGGSWKVGSQKPRFLWDVGGFTHMIFVWMLIATALPGLTGAHYDLCESDRRDHPRSGGRVSWGPTACWENSADREKHPKSWGVVEIIT